MPATRSFDEFLAALAARKRKTIRRERHDALANGISVHWLTGSDLTEDVWDTFFAFYMDTGSRKWGRPYLTRPFFSLVGETMRDRILLVMAKRSGRWIAGAINFIGSHTLFGRHWGAIEHHPFLHFELCYYQAIDYAIAHKLPRVEAGAQGEHKIARGYMPTTTYSAHYIADPALRRGDRRLSGARARLYRRGRHRACRGRSLPQGFHSRSGLITIAATFNCARSCRRPVSDLSGSCAEAESTMPSYDPNNVFAKILRGELPAHKVYEDDKAFAFLDIMPRAPGHTLVIPKAPARTILDIEPDDLAHLIKATQKIARAAMTVFSADGLTIQQFNEAAGGQLVFHLHIHVIPRKIGVSLRAAGKLQGRAGGAVGPGAEACCRAQRRVRHSSPPTAQLGTAAASAPARDALDLGPHQAFDHAGQIVVEPSLQHGPQHLAHQVLERARVLHQHGVRQRVESGVDRGARRARQELARTLVRRRARPRVAGATSRTDRSEGRGTAGFRPPRRSSHRNSFRSCEIAAPVGPGAQAQEIAARAHAHKIAAPARAREIPMIASGDGTRRRSGLRLAAYGPSLIR